jgi:hypothetical protein
MRLCVALHWGGVFIVVLSAPGTVALRGFFDTYLSHYRAFRFLNFGYFMWAFFCLVNILTPPVTSYTVTRDKSRLKGVTPSCYIKYLRPHTRPAGTVKTALY